MKLKRLKTKKNMKSKMKHYFDDMIQLILYNDCINCENAANLNIPCTHCLPVSLYIIIIRDWMWVMKNKLNVTMPIQKCSYLRWLIIELKCHGNGWEGDKIFNWLTHNETGL